MGTRDPWSELLALDVLEVGAPVVEPDRIVATYRAVRGREVHTVDLMYKYGEAVFEPGEAASENLAAVMAAQPAMNYGLFCREIVFRGRLDRLDRKFIEEMTRHTGREIYVNRLVKPNPFLDPALQASITEPPPDFLRAQLRFDGAEGPTAWWETHTSRCAVLSSGGKDSLLTYGMLKEIGLDVHPVFINESGRHWYTALNAHRYFERNVRNTARVWTTVDRVYNEMIRALPFIRRDYARIRADIYPVRLWTVAGFIFGALPLLRRRGVGRLVVGDEYDATMRLNHRGVTHYAGYYDQSRYFDNAMTRYYQRKRFGLSQFSVLRPLSELLIQKTLVERYPELQREQVSCHATHIVEGRARPCGSCEKCRRIVGMLVALGSDPKACGYTQEQVTGVLTKLGTRGVAQELVGSEHLYHLLVRGGHIRPVEGMPVSARAHREVAQLRFDPERSPFDTIPNDLRAPLYRIMMEHAEGAVMRTGRQWVAFDPGSEASLSAPYRFEGA